MSVASLKTFGLLVAARPVFALPLALSLLGACSSTLEGDEPPGGNAGTAGSAGSAGSSGASNGGASGSSGASGTGNTSGGGTTGGTGVGGTGITPQCADQNAITPGRAQLRRLTIPEYNNTVRDIIGETSNPAFLFPSEVSGNGFGNDARFQGVSSILAQNHNQAAETIAARVTGTPATFAALLPCSSSVTAANHEACARTFVESWVPTAYRRPLVTSEIDELVALYTTVQGIVDDDPATTLAARFASGIAAIIEAVLVTPEFLYKPEFGVADAANPAVKRPSGPEMATRLSYLFWASSPDAELVRAAQAGELQTNAGVRAQAERLLGDQRVRGVVRYFFDNVLPYTELANAMRDSALYPTWNTARVAMAQEARAFLEYEVFDPAGSGTWPGILSAPYTFVNQELAAYYGMPPVAGDTFQKVPLDTTQRLGLLTQGLFTAGKSASNHTNPVARGGYIVNHLMCRNVSFPSDPAILDLVKPPDPYSAPTARQRYAIHSENDLCAGCHTMMDPVGYALENFDAMGLYRTTENDVPIDASGEVPDMPGGDFGDCPSGIACAEKGEKYNTPCNGSCATELARRLSQNAEVMACFPQHWLDYAYGQTLEAANPDDVCNREALVSAFAADGYNVKQLLVAISQTDGFLYLGSQE